MISVWARKSFQRAGAANVVQLFCFSRGSLRTDVPMSAAKYGLPSPEAMQLLEVRELPRTLDVAWFDGFRTGALRGVAERTLGDLKALDEATHLTAVLVERADTGNLVHLQAAWAVCQWLVARGATVVLDAQTTHYWKGADVASWPAERPFTLSVDVRVTVEADPGAPFGLVHTRGLQKFGRPDLVVTGVPSARWDAVAGLVRSAAGLMADGLVLEPDQTLQLGDELIRVSRFTPTSDADPHLNNAGLQLTSAFEAR